MASRLIFDGDCAFCTTTAQWAGRHLPADTDVVPWQRVSLAPLGLSEADVTTAVYWVDERGRTWRGHRAAGQALLAMGGAWRALGWLCLVPPTSWVARALYRVVAINRHRMPGGTAACRLDAPH